MDVPRLSIHSPVAGSDFWLLGIMLLRSFMYKCVDQAFMLSWIDIRNEIAGSCGEFMLGFLGNSQTLPEWLHHLHSYQQCMRVPVSLCPAPTFAVLFY